MKNMKYGITFGIALVCAMLFTVCDNITDTPKTQKPVKNDYGKISIGFTGEMAHQDAPPQSARTVLPLTVFDKYVYTFTKAGGTTGIVKAPNDDGFFTLEVGSYTVAVQAYIGTKEPYTLAASGVSPQFSVGSGSNTPVKVPLSEVAAATVGKFSYTITWPAGSTAEITLQKWPELNTIALNPVNVTQGNGKTQTLELGTGSYLLTVLVSKSGLYAGISEAVRIYPFLSTVYTKDFVDDDLLQIVAPTLTLTAGNAKITYTWTASYPAADSYDVYWKAGSGLTAASVKTGAKITGASSGGEITGLTNGTAYSVVVTANKAGNSVDSTVQTAKPVINAVQPVISVQPQGGTFFKTGTLSVTASVTDGGTLSYQWYRNTSNSTSGGTAIAGATGSSRTLSDAGTYWYYVIVTNTITNNGDGGIKTAQTTSNATAVTIELVQLAQWARTVSAGNEGSYFTAVAVDSSGNVYAAGYQDGNGTNTYGTNVSAQGSVRPNNSNVVLVKYNSSGTAQWARTVTVAGGDNSYFYSCFNAVAVDKDGNVYAAGEQRGYGTYTYGTGVSAQGSVRPDNYNVVLVKYDSSGTAQWARTVSTGSYDSLFKAVAVDKDGNVYAAGYQVGNSTYTYGSGVSVQVAVSNGWNVVLVKYNSSGTAQWAQSVNTGTNYCSSNFNAVAVDSFGNVYAAGSQLGSAYSSYTTFTYGSGVSAQVTKADDNVVLVKYNSGGTAQWARTVTTSGTVNSGGFSPRLDSSFFAVAVDSSGNVYAAGQQKFNVSGSGQNIDSSNNTITGTFTYGAEVSVQGTYSAWGYIPSRCNVVLVKYDSDGTAQWARSVIGGDNASISFFNSVAVDPSGNAYAAGYQRGNIIYTYGTGVSALGTYQRTDTSDGNVVLVKYDSGGTAQWARSVIGGASSKFNAVAVDKSGNVYAAGNQGYGTFIYGTGVSAQGTSGSNVVLVKYRE